MTKVAKIWIWLAILLCTATTVLNAMSGRIPSVVIAAVSIVGLVVLVLTERKWGFYLTCACYVCSFAVGVFGGLQGGTNLLTTLIMSLIGSLLVPVITFLLIRKQFSKLK